MQCDIYDIWCTVIAGFCKQFFLGDGYLFVDGIGISLPVYTRLTGKRLISTTKPRLITVGCPLNNMYNRI